MNSSTVLPSSKEKNYKKKTYRKVTDIKSKYDSIEHLNSLCNLFWKQKSNVNP